MTQAVMIFAIFVLLVCGCNGYMTGEIDESQISGTIGTQYWGTVSTSWVGWDVERGGDLNNDGYDELLVGAFKYDNTNKAGRALVIFGSANPSSGDAFNNPDVVVFTGEPGEHLGFAVTWAGDFNNDGIDDMMLGAGDFYASSGNGGDGPGDSRTNCGEVYMFWGSLTAHIDYPNYASIGASTVLYDNGPGRMNENAAVGVVFYGSTTSEFAGFYLSHLGDINGDSFEDVCIVSGNINSKGGFYFVHGADSWTTPEFDLANADATFVLGDTASNDAAIPVESAGDIDNDGLGDVIVGGQKSWLTLSQQGEVYLIFGRTAWETGQIDLEADYLNTNKAAVFLGRIVSNFCGRDVGYFGDLDNDGYDDVMVGCDGGNHYGTKTGEVFIIHGRSRSDWSTSATTFPAFGNIEPGITHIVGPTAGDQIGFNVHNAGDVNEDGVDDLIVGGQKGDGACRGVANTGEAIVLMGSPALGANIDLLAVRNDFNLNERAWFDGGSTTSTLFGNAVAGNFDFNGDGISDIVIGAYKSGTGASAGGKVNIVYGPIGTDAGCPARPAPAFASSTCESTETPETGYCGTDSTCTITCDSGYEFISSPQNGVDVCPWQANAQWEYEEDLTCVLIDDCASAPCLNDGVCSDAGIQAFSCNCAGTGYEGTICDEELDECASTPCENGGTCTDEVNNFNCDCTGTGYEGTTCGDNIDDCASVPCENGGTCTDEVNDFTCDCTGTGYEGTTCADDIDDCASTPCENGGTCTDGVNDFTCDCTGTGYEGDTCAYNIDDCASVPCDNGGTCTDGVNAFTCDCTGTGHGGTTCADDIDDCTSAPCENGGTCTDAGVDQYTCECTGTGYEGETCSDNIDDCASLPCENGGTCTDGVNDFTCDCTGTGYEGTTCADDIDDCTSAPCENGGTCTDAGVDQYTCDCTGTGYEGETCSDNIDDCASLPCENGGTCTDGVNDFTCDCTATGYEGTTCADNIDDCASVPCENGGTCTDEVNDFTCDCTGTGYEGTTCADDIDDCASTPCENGGICTDGVNAFACDCSGTGHGGTTCADDIDDCTSAPCENGGTCTDTGVDQYTCDCTGTGYEGDTCADNIDDCASTPCENGGTCTDFVNDFTCDCAGTGYEGTTCADNIDDCASTPCENGGTCTDGVNDFTCDCTGTGYEGTTCGDNVDDCASTPCVNGGTCTDGVNTFTCDCTGTGHGGTTCADDIDDCTSAPCENGGTCTDTGVDQYTCDCTGTGYEGTTCADDIDDCTSAPCENGGTCTDGVNTFTCDCSGTGYEGTTCADDIDDCTSAPCENGGTCTDGVNTFTCECPVGYSGSNCDTLTASPCDSDPCDNFGICSAAGVGFTCNCTGTGFGGSTCTDDIDDCTSNPCQNGGTCIDTGAYSYFCDCTETGYEGPVCQDEIDDCASAPCEHGGTCTDIGAGFECDCTDTGYEDETCGTIINTNIYCDTANCQNGGTCVDGVDGFFCECVLGWEGIECEDDVDECASNPCLHYDCVEDGIGEYHCELPPDIVLVAPEEVSYCSDFILDASGSTGLTENTTSVEWNVYLGDVMNPDFDYNDFLALDALMPSFNDELVVEINASIWLTPNVTYLFFVEIENGLGLTDQAFVETFVNTFPVPILTISAPGTIYMSSDATLQGMLTYSDCFPKGTVASYEWTCEYDNEGTIEACPATTGGSVTSLNLLIEAFSLEIGVSYTFRLSAAFEGAGRTSASHVVVPSASPVVAIIDGSDRLVSSLNSVDLDASGSYDPDLNPASNDGLSYQWSCVFRGTSYDCGFDSNDYDGSDSTAVLEIPSGLLDEVFDYTFKVTVTRDSDGSSATTSVNIDVEAAPVINVGIEMTEPTPSGSNPEVVWQSSKLSLTGTADWTENDGSNFIYLWSVASSENPVNMSDASTALNTPYVTFDCNVLPLGVTTFNLYVTDTIDGSTVVGYATKSIEISNSAPTSKARDPLTTSIVGGPDPIEFETQVTMTANQWESNAPDTKPKDLTYQFRYIDMADPEMVEIIVSPVLNSKSFTAYLPSGDLMLIVYVTDTVGVSTRYELEDTFTVDGTSLHGGIDDPASIVCFTDTSELIDNAVAGGTMHETLNLVKQFATELYWHVDPRYGYACDDSSSTLTVTEDFVPEWNTILESFIDTNVALTHQDAEFIAQTLVSLVNLHPELDITSTLDHIFTSLFASISSCSSGVDDTIVRVLSAILTSESCEAQELVQDYLYQLMDYDLSNALPGEDPTEYVSDLFTAMTASVYPGEEATITFGDGVTITFPESDEADAAVNVNIVEFSSDSTCFGNTSDVVSPIVDIDVDGLTQDGFTFTMIPGIDFDTLLDNTCDQQGEEIACSFYDETTGDWSQEGCDTQYMADGTIECTCYHTTAFALMVRSVDDELACEEMSEMMLISFWLFAALYFLTMILAIVQIARIIKAKVKISFGAMYQVEHVVIVGVALCRGLMLLMLALQEQVHGVLSVIFNSVPICLLFAGFTFVVASWAAIYHFSMRQPKSFFEPLKIPFGIANAIVFLVMIGLIISVYTVEDDETEVMVAQAGAAFVAFINLVSAIGFMFYGARMYHTLKQGSIRSKSTNKPWLSRTENRIFLATTIFSICFGVAAILAIMDVAQEFELNETMTIMFFAFELFSIWCMLYLFQQGVDSAVNRALQKSQNKSGMSRSTASRVTKQDQSRLRTNTQELKSVKPEVPSSKAPMLSGGGSSDDYVAEATGPKVRERLDGEGLITSDVVLEPRMRSDDTFTPEEF